MSAWDGFVIFFAIIFAAVLGFWAASDMDNGPRWACNAEDEVVVIDNTCRHIDTLKGE